MALPSIGVAVPCEDPISVLPLSECVLSELFLDRRVWSDISTDDMLLIPLEAYFLDTMQAEAQLARDQDQASHLFPPRWQDVTILSRRRFWICRENLQVLGGLRTSSSEAGYDSGFQYLQGCLGTQDSSYLSAPCISLHFG